MSLGTILIAIACFIFFCLAVQLFDEIEKGVKVGYLGFFFLTLGMLLGGIALPVIRLARRTE